MNAKLHLDNCYDFDYLTMPWCQIIFYQQEAHGFKWNGRMSNFPMFRNPHIDGELFTKKMYVYTTPC